MNNLVVLGAGPLGMAIIDELIETGKKVTLVNRSGKVNEQLSNLVTVMACDLTDTEAVKTICQDADIVYMCAVPPYTKWAEEFPPLMSSVIEALSHTKTRLVYADNLYMYGKLNGQTMNEQLPYKAKTKKGMIRAKMAQMILSAHENGQLDAKMVRASDFFGPRVLTSAFGKDFFLSILNNKPVNLIGNPHKLHSITYIRDFARAMVAVGEDNLYNDVVFHTPNAPVVSTMEFANLIGGKIGKKIKIRKAGSITLKLLGTFNPIIHEIEEMLYQWTDDFVVDHSQITNKFNLSATPFEKSIEETVEWFSKMNS